jgi:polyphosphate kinase 2 (PPK2 family)
MGLGVLPSPAPIKSSSIQDKVGAVPNLKKKFYNQELRCLQVQLVKLQSTIKQRKLKVVILFEGRDAAGKGGAIKRIT